MVKVKGRDQVKALFASLPADLEKLAAGAARAAAKVIAEEASERCISSEVRSAIKVSTKAEPGRAISKVHLKGPGAFKGKFLEYGTAAHFISVDDSQRQGMGVLRINKLDRQARREGKIGEKESLVINGRPVGETVSHPGAMPHPFMRPALDLKEGDAIAAAQNYIHSRISRSGVRTEPDGDEL